MRSETTELSWTWQIRQRNTPTHLQPAACVVRDGPEQCQRPEDHKSISSLCFTSCFYASSVCDDFPHFRHVRWTPSARSNCDTRPATKNSLQHNGRQHGKLTRLLRPKPSCLYSFSTTRDQHGVVRVAQGRTSKSEDVIRSLRAPGLVRTIPRWYHRILPKATFRSASIPQVQDWS
jgi:hypothetical protein